MINKKIALIGLGYVGLPLAVEFGKKREKGFGLPDKQPSAEHYGKPRNTLRIRGS